MIGVKYPDDRVGSAEYGCLNGPVDRRWGGAPVRCRFVSIDSFLLGQRSAFITNKSLKITYALRRFAHAAAAVYEHGCLKALQ